jgi:type II secretory pathway predicted ATPase ExeA
VLHLVDLLSDYPELRNDLRRSNMEEISYRMSVFDFDGIASSSNPTLPRMTEGVIMTS